MSVLDLLGTGLGTFAILQFLVVPLIERRIQGATPKAAVGLAGMAALLGYLKQLAIVAALTAGVLLVATTWVRSMGMGSEFEWQSAILSAREGKASLSRFGGGWSLFVLIALVVALGLSAYRNGRLFGQERLGLAYKEAVGRLTAQQELGRLEKLPPTREMRGLARQAKELEKLAGSEGDATKRELYGKLQEECLELIAAHDMQRRLEIRLEPDEDPDTRSLSSKLQVVFSSKGWFKSIEGFSRALSYSGLGLLFVSLVAFNSGTVEASLSERIVKLEDLVIRSEREALSSAFSEVYQTPSTEPTSTPLPESMGETEAIETLARLFEDALLSTSDFIPSDVPTEAAVRAARSQIARRGIIAAAQKVGSQSVGIEFERAVSTIDGLDPLEKKGLELLEQDLGATRPRTKTGARFAQSLREEVRPYNTEAWKGAVQKVKNFRASFATPVESVDLGKMLVGETFGMALDGAAPSTDDVLLDLYKSMVSKSSGASVEEYYDVKMKQFLVDVGKASNLEEGIATFVGRGKVPVSSRAASAISQLGDDLPRMGSLVEKLAQHPPSVSSRAEAGLQVKKATQRVQGTRSLFATGTIEADFLTDSLLGYDDLAPSKLGAELSTDLAKVLARNDPAWLGRATAKAGEAGFKKASGAMARSASHFARGGSFKMMRSFWRVGGVVIGREPEGDGQLDFVDISWKQEGTQTTLTVSPLEGAPIEIGPFRNRIIHRALIYAADGRPLAVTMTSAPPLNDLKIHLHPALIDTRLGSRAIEIDRFVDRFVSTEPGSRRGGYTAKIENQMAFYELAWACRMLATLAHFGLLDESDIWASGSGAFQALAAQANELGLSIEPLDFKPRWLLASIGLDTSVAGDSLLAAKSEYFDPALVGNLTKAVRTSQDLDEMTRLLFQSAQESLPKRGRRAQRSFEDFLDSSEGARIMAPPPETEIWSGVREATFTLDPKLGFANDEDKADWPLEFMIQVAFTTPPEFLSGEQDPETFTDLNPFEFNALASTISREIRRGLEENQDAQIVMNDIREFTILQRFFRTALSGDLGDGFPVEKLAALTEATGEPQSEYSRTLRWNPRPGFLEYEVRIYLDYLQSSLNGHGEQRGLLLEIQAYVDRVGDALLAVQDLEELSTSEWDEIFQAGKGEEADVILTQLLGATQELAPPGMVEAELLGPFQLLLLKVRARALRDVLGVDVDDQQAGRRVDHAPIR